MFAQNTPTEPTALENTLTHLFDSLDEAEPDSEEYAKIADQVVKLYKLKEIDAPKRVSPDTWALIGANLAGIILILGHERINVITSKALSFVSKLR